MAAVPRTSADRKVWVDSVAGKDARIYVALAK